jgi:cytochrome b561
MGPAIPRYSAVAIVLHWLVAAAILATFPLGLYMADLPLSPRKLMLVSYHKLIGEVGKNCGSCHDNFREKS